MISYPEISKLPWPQVVQELSREAKMPLSVHIPLNMPFSQRFVYCDCAMNAYVLEMPPHLVSGTWRGETARHLQRIKLISFAFGENPFVPDYRQVALSRKFGGLPIIRAELDAWDLVYQAEYCTGPDGVLHIRMKVRNEGFKEQDAHVWVRSSWPLEEKAFDYHYISWTWNASRWQDCQDFQYGDARVYDATGVFLLPRQHDFQMSWVREENFQGKDFNKGFIWGTPYYVQPEMRLERIQNALHFQTKLAPNEEKSFEIAVETASLGSNRLPDSPDYETVEQQAVEAWGKILADRAELRLPEMEDLAAIQAVELCNLQLLLATDKGLQPCQGGSSERFYVWVWEALCALRPMLRLGYARELRPVLAYLFTLQDGGCPPVGKFTSLKGAIGTSGPKWANTTGSALILAAEYFNATEDRDFLREFLPKMLAAGDWILGEIRATRQEGVRNPGVMPEACASDGDYGQLIFTDCWTLAGLEKLRDVLKLLGHPRAGELETECRQYKAALDATLARVTREDGFVSRSYGDPSRVCTEFRFTDTVMDCVACGVSSATEPCMANFLRWMEQNAFDGLFCSVVTRGIYYVGNNELTVLKEYLELGEWKKAWAAARMFRRFVMTPDVYLTQERYSSRDTGFTAWQPNASNNGRFLDMELTRMYHEVPGGIILYGAFTPEEMKACPGFRNVFTRYGRTSLTIKDGQAVLETARPIPEGTRIVTPWQELLLGASVQCVCLPLQA